MWNWKDGSVGKGANYESKTAWFHIPSTHTKSWAWLLVPVIPALRGRGSGSQEFTGQLAYPKEGLSSQVALACVKLI